jgi:ribosomal protein L28
VVPERDGDQLDISCEKCRSVTKRKWDWNILYTIERKNANWIGRILRREFLLKHIFKGKVEGRAEVTGRRASRGKQLVNDHKETGRNWNVEEEAPDRTLWRTCFGRV